MIIFTNVLALISNWKHTVMRKTLNKKNLSLWLMAMISHEETNKEQRNTKQMYKLTSQMFPAAVTPALSLLRLQAQEIYLQSLNLSARRNHRWPKTVRTY